MEHASRLLATRLVLGGLVGGLSAFGAPVPKASPNTRLLGIDRFESSSAAAAAWRAQGAFDDQGALDAKKSTRPAAVVPMGGRNVLELTCNFARTDMGRAVWDRRIEHDFSLVTAVVFDVYAENVKGVAYMHLYIGTGEGWYGAEWYPAQEAEWCRVRIPIWSVYPENIETYRYLGMGVLPGRP